MIWLTLVALGIAGFMIPRLGKAIMKFMLAALAVIVLGVVFLWLDENVFNPAPPSYYVMTLDGDTWAGPYYPLTAVQHKKCTDAAVSMAESNPAKVSPVCKVR